MKPVGRTKTKVNNKNKMDFGMWSSNFILQFITKEKAKEVEAALLLLFPFFFIESIFMIYPIFYSLRISFMDFSYLNPDAAVWVGGKNYVNLFRDKTFITSLKNTLKLVLIVVPLQTVIALILANILNAKLKFKTFLRTVYFMPYVTSTVAVGAIMVYLFTKDGMATQFMTIFGFDNVAWYADGRYAFYLIVAILVWTQMGFYTVIYLSGLQNISEEVYEAATIDGASSLQRFLYITLPLLNPTTFLVLVMGVLATLQVFEQPYVVSTTGEALPGSPSDTTLTMVMFLYTQAFKYFNMGFASAAAFVIFIIIFIITMIQYLFFEKGEAKGGN